MVFGCDRDLFQRSDSGGQRYSQALPFVIIVIHCIWYIKGKSSILWQVCTKTASAVSYGQAREIAIILQIRESQNHRSSTGLRLFHLCGCPNYRDHRHESTFATKRKQTSARIR